MRSCLTIKTTIVIVAILAACNGDGLDTKHTVERAKPGVEEHERNILALRPPKRVRPLIAVLADNAGTETTDFLVPYGVLSESNLAA